MSRAVHLTLDFDAVTELCEKNGIAISAIEPLPSGGTRVVLMTSEHALRLRQLCKAKLFDGPVARSGEHQARRPIAYS